MSQNLTYPYSITSKRTHYGILRIYEVHFKSNAHTAKNQSNLFIQVNFHITSFNVVHPGFDDTFPAIGNCLMSSSAIGVQLSDMSGHGQI